MSSLYILYIYEYTSPLSHTFTIDIFFQYIAHHFLFLMMSFEKQRILILMKFNL